MMRLLLALAAVVSLATAADDPRVILRKTVEWDQHNWERARDYTHIEEDIQRELNGRGQVTQTKSETAEVLFLYGRPYRKRIAEDGKPLPPDKARKEEEKLDKAAEDRRRDDAHGGRKRLEWERKRREEHRFLLEIPEAYDLTLLREEQFSGMPVWVIGGTPRPDYKPKVSDAWVLKKIKPTFWIEKQGYRLVRVDGEVLDTLSFGLFLIRVGRGSQLTLTQTRVNNDVWMPKQLVVKVDGRLGLIKKLNLQFEANWRDYRRFQTDSKVLPVE